MFVESLHEILFPISVVVVGVGVAVGVVVMMNYEAIHGPYLYHF